MFNMRTLNKYILFAIFLILNTLAFGQELKRQGDWGMYVKEIPDSLKSTNPDGVMIYWLTKNCVETQAGLKVNDILLKIGNQKVNSVSDYNYSNILNPYRDGDKIKYVISRNGKKKVIKTKVIPKPYEKLDNADVVYDAVEFKGGQLRTILTKPKSVAKLPVIYFIPGYNCASYDNMFTIHPYKRIIDSLTNLGYAVFRCEKSGMGDCSNTPNCFDIDFLTEQAGFEAGYEKLLSYDFIDTSQIYLFGHSLGGINTPLLANKYNPKGIIVYGTTHLRWADYMKKMVVFQNPILGVDEKIFSEDLLIYDDLSKEIFVNHKSPKEVIEMDPNYLRILERDFLYEKGDMLMQRNYEYMFQLNQVDLSKSWSLVNSKVLSVYGASDFEALNSESHEEIVKIVNKNHPNNAVFVLLPETNHIFIKVGSMEDEIEATENGEIRELLRTSFNYDIITIIDDWIRNE